MMSGVVTAEREAVLKLEVRDNRGGRVEVDAVIDTGFTGFGWCRLHYRSHSASGPVSRIEPKTP